MAAIPSRPLNSGHSGAVGLQLGCSRRPLLSSAPVPVDSPRLLHRRSEKGYTRSTEIALHEEPEAISEVEQLEMSKRARDTFEVARAEELAKKQTKSRCHRLKEAESLARRKSVDVQRYIVAIEGEITAIERLVA